MLVPSILIPLQSINQHFFSLYFHYLFIIFPTIALHIAVLAIHFKWKYDLLYLSLVLEWSTTESSDDVEKQELEEASDEEEARFFDTNDYFPEPSVSCELEKPTNDMMQKSADKDTSMCLQVERRKKLPDPIEKEKGVSLWSMIKDNVGKDLTRVCLPVYFNEPLSSLQRSFEDLEYSYLLDRAYKHGKEVCS